MVWLVPTLELHPTFRGTRYTLRGIFRTEAAARNKGDELVASGLETYGFSEVTPAGHEAFFVAARHSVEPSTRSAIPHDHSPAWEVTRFAVFLFRQLTKTRDGTRVRWYKGLDVPALHGRIQAFAGQRGDLASRASWLLSDLIVTHPFPNANHRTSLDLLRYYLYAHDIQWPYELRGQGRTRFHRQTKPFFIQSKYLLQLLRHRAMIREAVDSGYDSLQIGDQARQDIIAADLQLRDNELRRRHRQICLDLITQLPSDATRRNIERQTPLDLQGWAAWLAEP